MTPQRIQRKRTKGWKKPEGAVYVGRGTRWGNSWTIENLAGTFTVGRHGAALGVLHGTKSEAAAHAVQLYEKDMGAILGGVVSDALERKLRADLATLTGKDLMCWCPPGEPCHADVLIELANQEETSQP